MTWAKPSFAALVAALLILPAKPPVAAGPAVEPAAGELLIASAAMQDPRFYHSVILLLRHDEKGAFGIVINHPLTERPIAGLLADSLGPADQDAQDGAIEGNIRIFLGGPVEPSYGFVIHSGEYHRPETLTLDIGVAMTATREILRDIGRHRGPKKYLFALGYAGWGAGQLEGEIARHDWFTTPAEPDLVFDEERGKLWERALARRTREL
ncbi:MAG TPA: YqgE/AlgH family protein [Stellaceae bacterium]|nr:YqgE/AlgH family protein [Stellaceae bacterium]